MVEPAFHFEFLPAQQRDLLNLLAEQSWLQPFYLAGGTALALHIGHRQSVDFDFFTLQDFQTRAMIAALQPLGAFELFSEAENTVNALLNEVRISFFTYRYPLIQPFHYYRQVAIADLRDIAAMKCEAISGRGSKKDFIDLAFLLRYLSLSEIFDLYEAKYGRAVSNHYHLLKSLVYFDDAEEQPMPRMSAPVSWEEIKQQILTMLKQAQVV